MLIYTAYSILDQDQPPDWVAKFRDNPVVRREAWSIYDPLLGMRENLESDVKMAGLLASPHQVNQTAMRNAKELRLDPDLFRPLAQVMARMQASDQGPTVDVPFKHLYALLRSDIVLVDLNAPEHGEKSQEVLYAYLTNVPVVGISHRFILSPWMVGKINAVICPSTSDEIVRQVLAHDHKISTMLTHYRMVENAMRQTEETKPPVSGENLEELRGKLSGLATAQQAAVGQEQKAETADDAIPDQVR